jgi:hypothetical protein
MITKHNGFIILGSTGCSCCRCDNFVQGIFQDEESAKATVESHQRNKTVSSQYSKNGNYTIKPVDYELINDGRVILGDRVLENESFVLTGESEYYAFS